MIHNHWTILAFKELLNDPNSPQKKGQIYNDGCLVKVDADTEDEAIEKAKELIKRNHYRVNEVMKCAIDHEQSQDMQMLALELQAKMLKKL